jgi:hypothetical protein
MGKAMQERVKHTKEIVKDTCLSPQRQSSGKRSVTRRTKSDRKAFSNSDRKPFSKPDRKPFS